MTARNLLDIGAAGERGAGGTGATSTEPVQAIGRAAIQQGYRVAYHTDLRADELTKYNGIGPGRWRGMAGFERSINGRL